MLNVSEGTACSYEGHRVRPSRGVSHAPTDGRTSDWHACRSPARQSSLRDAVSEISSESLNRQALPDQSVSVFNSEKGALILAG